mgnify:CR=1 FL=1
MTSKFEDKKNVLLFMGCFRRNKFPQIPTNSTKLHKFPQIPTNSTKLHKTLIYLVNKPQRLDVCGLCFLPQNIRIKPEECPRSG